jgi:multidrug efflux pump subunit AcrA (membrane-fusion protein)
VPETYAAFIHDNNEIRFRVNAEPDKTYMGIFSRKAGSLDAETRTETWEFIYMNPDGNLKPGLITQVDLRLKRREPVFIIPFTALVTNLERSFVIRVNRNTAEWVDVKNGISFSDKIEIFGLLQEGDLLILRANDEIRPGKEIYALKK